MRPEWKVVGAAVRLLLHFDHAIFGYLGHRVPRPGSGRGGQKQGETDTNYPPRSHTSTQIKQHKLMRACQRNAATAQTYTNTLEDARQRPAKQRQTILSIYTSAHTNAYIVQNVHTGRECVCVTSNFSAEQCSKMWLKPGRGGGGGFVCQRSLHKDNCILQLNASSKDQLNIYAAVLQNLMCYYKVMYLYFIQWKVIVIR